jgi:outer membrane protein TolC
LPGSVSVGEMMVSIEHPVRWWGKAGVDADLSKQMQSLGQLGYSDALHEASRELVSLWFGYLRALSGQKNAERSLEIAKEMNRQALARLRLGEISRLDSELAAAELARAQAAVHMSSSARQTAHRALAGKYPAIPLPEEIRIFPSPELNGLLNLLQQDYLAKNHEINMLRVDAARLEFIAQRTLLDRKPDPTIGIFAASDRGGAEKVAGFSLSIPLAGTARTAQSRAALADVEAAREKVRASEQRLGQEFESHWIHLHHKRLAAEQLRLASQTQQVAAEKTRRAYALGEAVFSDVLAASRNASENRLLSDQMHLEAAELHDLIRLDLHQFWDFDE